MHYEIDLSGEAPELVGAPLAVLPAGVRGLAQSSLDDLSAALDPCPAALVGRAFWPIVDGNPPTLEPWERQAAAPDHEIEAENNRILAVYAAEDKPLAAYRAALKTAINTEARARILALVPSWTAENHAEKQRNAIARGVQLLRRIAGGTATQGEIDEADAIEALWNQVDAIRAASNVATAAIEAAESAQAAYGAAAAVSWPSPS